MSLSNYVLKNAQVAISGDTKQSVPDRIQEFMRLHRFVIAEPKIDGMRVFLISTEKKYDRDSVMASKHNGTYTKFDFPALYANIESVVSESVLDCELVKKDQKLLAFDILFLNGNDVRQSSLETRKQLIGTAFKSYKPSDSVISEQLRGAGLSEVNWIFTDSLETVTDYYENVVKNGGEGIMLKDPYAYYGARNAWLKLKYTETFDCIVIGCRDTETSKQTGVFVSWELGLYENGKLVYVGDSNTYTKDVDPKQIHVGDVVEVRHQPTVGFDDLRNAVILRKRLDKVESECTTEQMA